MALTGHRVICWNEGGEICEPRLESEKSVAVMLRARAIDLVFS